MASKYSRERYLLHRDERIKWNHDHKKEIREYYLKNRDKFLLQVSKNKLKITKWYINLKSKPCKDCGKRYPSYVMDFDHTRGKKKFRLAGNIYARSKKDVIKEMAKCDLVCANCHRIRTHKRQQEKRKERLERLKNLKKRGGS